MPELVIAGSSTINSAVSPPPEAFQPVLRILKRPTATAASSSSSTPTPDPDANSYAAREARYQAARERIFGDSSPTPDQQPANSKTGPKKAVASVQIAREPKGPPATQFGTAPGGTDQGGDARGFSSRRGKRRGGPSGKP
ncbi:hypothetical protein K466DRAFT_587945 [Polyporus arcularius HHB13444]|uniref:SUZ domain-containing protein n=1 Tax=Polyporus arcularius HHB13444 TaxID=1314778 RepID=A0A5C3PBQ6_9APHY|nr:hypothetical protein K466DRAFT_587945 [Polyporus arcularius HHB13444]